MKNKSRNENKFANIFEDQDFIDTVMSKGYASCGDVSKILGCHRNTAKSRLNGLVEDGILKRSMVGGMWVYQT